MVQIIPGVACVEALPPDATGRPRGIRWLPFRDPDSRSADGVLGIVSGSRTAPDRCYMVREYTPDSAWDGRAFVVRRAGALEPYHVFICRNGQDHACDCRAGQVGRTRCVHVEAMLAILANSWMRPEFADAPEPESDPFA